MPSIRHVAQTILAGLTPTLFEKGTKTAKEAGESVGKMLVEFQRDRNKNRLLEDKAWKEMLTDMGDIREKLMRIEMTLKKARGA